MKEVLYKLVLQQNPWLSNPDVSVLPIEQYIPREFDQTLLSAEFDDLCLVLTGPRRAGKTTLGYHLVDYLLRKTNRFDQLLYLNCDFAEVRDWLSNTLFIKEAFSLFSLKRPVVFIDEIQRLASPGLLLKTLVDLRLPIRLMATGSSQLELKSKVQEPMTGRNLSELILPLSIREGEVDWDARLIFGGYPRITLVEHKQRLLKQLFSDYIDKDIIQILQVRNADVMRRLLTLIAHSSGQLINYNQFAVDCGVTIPTIKHYLNILENTYVISKVTPFVGNLRAEITSNPVYYFYDNGFRNQALENFLSLEQRTDAGLLVESFVYQELFKFTLRNTREFKIHYWRTKSGAEVDFVLTHQNRIIPIEVKFRNLSRPTISRGFRSFVQAYSPRQAFIITKQLIAVETIENCEVVFIPLEKLNQLFDVLAI